MGREKAPSPMGRRGLREVHEGFDSPPVHQEVCMLCQCSLDSKGNIQAICWGCLQRRLERVIGLMEQAVSLNGEACKEPIRHSLALLHRGKKELEDER